MRDQIFQSAVVWVMFPSIERQQSDRLILEGNLQVVTLPYYKYNITQLSKFQ